MKKNKKWCTLLVFVPFIIFFVFTNYYIDPANIFHDESKEIANAVIQGKAAYSASGNGNERMVKYNIIVNMPKHVDCVAIGSSLLMGIRTKDVNEESFYNLGVSGSNFYDYLAQIGLMEIYEIEVDRVIISADAYFFHKEIYENQKASLPLRPYSEYMLNILYGKDAEVPCVEEERGLQTKIEQLFSVTYFQSAMEYVNNRGHYSMNDARWGIVGEDFDGSKPYYCTDGSWMYKDSVKNANVDTVKKASDGYKAEYFLAKNASLGEYECEVFEKIVQYFLDKGVEVDIFVCPLAPALWDKVAVEIENYPMLTEIEQFANDIGQKYDLDVIGSYNPYNLGMTNEDFYDARHVRHELLSEFFDFK